MGVKKQLGKFNLPERLRVKHHICPVYKTGELITIMTFKEGRDSPFPKRLLELAETYSK